jgi:hypothetical protein
MERVDSGLVTVMANRRFPGSHITRLSEAPIRRLRRPDMPALKAEFGYRDVCAPAAIASAHSPRRRVFRPAAPTAILAAEDQGDLTERLHPRHPS